MYNSIIQFIEKDTKKIEEDEVNLLSVLKDETPPHE